LVVEPFLTQSGRGLADEPTVRVFRFRGVSADRLDEQLGLDAARGERYELIACRLFWVRMIATRRVCLPEPFKQVI
jgi:hypothetical protein